MLSAGGMLSLRPGGGNGYFLFHCVFLILNQFYPILAHGANNCKTESSIFRFRFFPDCCCGADSAKYACSFGKTAKME
jgi:hypothetical protein